MKQLVICTSDLMGWITSKPDTLSPSFVLKSAKPRGSKSRTRIPNLESEKSLLDFYSRPQVPKGPYTAPSKDSGSKSYNWAPEPLNGQYMDPLGCGQSWRKLP